METWKPERGLIRAGFVLFTLALLTGFAVPAFRNTRMAVNGHVTGAMNALYLIALGLAWGLLTQTPAHAKLTKITFLYGTFANWGTSLLAAAWGTNKLTPLAGAGFTAAPWQEAIVQVFQVTLTMSIVIGAVSVVYALRGRANGV